MDVRNVIAAAVALGALGLVFGLVLAVTAKFFAVKTDERVASIVEVLPKANCGACGFAGCDAFASAVINGDAPPTGCSAGGNAVAQKIAAILGTEVDKREKMLAYVRCTGAHTVPKRYEYVGINSCFAAHKLSGGPLACVYGCLGFGDCASVCKFGALRVVQGNAVVDREKCTACGKCADACPRKLIEIIPAAATLAVGCSSRDKGGAVRENCSVGCIGCMLCKKACQHDAILFADNLAKIDQTKCIGCGECAAVCPRKIIHPLS